MTALDPPLRTPEPQLYQYCHQCLSFTPTTTSAPPSTHCINPACHHRFSTTCCSQRWAVRYPVWRCWACEHENTFPAKPPVTFWGPLGSTDADVDTDDRILRANACSRWLWSSELYQSTTCGYWRDAGCEIEWRIRFAEKNDGLDALMEKMEMPRSRDKGVF